MKVIISHLLLFFIASTFLLFSNCNIQRKSSSDTTVEPRSKGTPGVYQSLVDYLRRHPSIRIIGSGEDTQVFIRGMDTIVGETEPLFVIDGTMVGNSYVLAARIVDVNDIKSVEVFGVSEATTRYGLRGGQGAVVIYTKKN